MTNSVLAQSYLEKAKAQSKTIPVLMSEKAYSNVIRECQEIVELSLKAMLRQVGIEPPKYHDVGPFLLDHAEKFPPHLRGSLSRLADISGYLRKERELSFYGDIDFIPTEQVVRKGSP